MDMIIFFLAVLMALFGIVCVFASGDESGRNSNNPWPLMFLGTLGITTSLYLIFKLGAGNVGDNALATGAIYETKSMVQDGDGFIVVLKHDDKFTCHRLKQQPPPVFKKTEDPKNPYQPYSR